MEFFHPITMWLHAHPSWGIFFAFWVAFLESVAVVGAIIPGSITLTSIGALIGSGVLPLSETLIAAIIGAILGDGLSFWLGRHYQNKIERIWPFRQHPHLLERGKKFFIQHGGKSIFIGRFFGPLRSVLPLIAGSLNMPSKRYLFFNIVSGILWAPSYIFPGIIIGLATIDLAPEATAKLISSIFLLFITIWLGSWLIRWLIVWHIKQINDTLDQVWRYMRRHPRWYPLVLTLQRPEQPEHHGQLILGLSFLVMLFFFVLLSYQVIHHGLLTALNQPIWHLFQSIRTKPLDNLAIALTFIGDRKSSLWMFLVISGYFIYQREWRTSAYWCLHGVFLISAVLGSKLLFAISRPTGLIGVAASNSYPSGHATLSAGLLGFLSVLIAEQLPIAQRKIVYLSTAIIVGLIGLSRIYLGAHWLTDIMGGWLLALSLILFFILMYRRNPTPSLAIYSLIPVALLAILSGWSYLMVRNFHADQQFYSPNVSLTPVSYDEWWTQRSPLLPQYRKNRFGMPRQALNIQYAGSLSKLQIQLHQRGWENITPEYTFYDFLTRLVNYQQEHQLSILPHLYDNQRPALIMRKKLTDPKQIILLELWPSYFALLNQPHPLWIGNLYYIEAWQQHWFLLRKHEKHPSMASPLLILQADLPNELSKIVRFEDHYLRQLLLIDSF